MVFKDISGLITSWEKGYGYDPSLIIGIAWNSASSSPTLAYIDKDGNTIPTPSEIWFNSHPIFGKIWRCCLTAAGVPTFGSNARGDGLTLTADYIMTQFPLHYLKWDMIGTVKKWWISPFPWDGFVPVFSANQRGHASSPANAIYVGSYMAGANGGTTVANGSYNTIKATSWTGLKLTSKSGNLALTGDDAGTSGTIAHFEAAANLIGAGWGIVNIHTWAMIRLLTYIRLGTLNSQAAVGAGRSNSANTSALTNGSVSSYEDIMGRSSGTTDLLGVSLFGLENLWSNLWQFIIGYNSTDTAHNIVKRDGTGTLAGTLTSGNYDAVTSPLPLNGVNNISGTDSGAYCQGYVSAVGHDSAGLLDHLMIPSALAASETTGFCDFDWSHQSGIGQIGVLLAGGGWSSAGYAGVGCLGSNCAVSYADPALGARLEFIG
ncbi:MAG TPA: hypothetical protein VN429_00755 [Methanospirillum sp.]|uniref:hypothetical protein n=1 Tax=Methanospirillum sp. TaxID=45200 RepID=UPI002CA113CE|nr:hypothetical protein [Methanospirillum sp.]HWQ62913.1 hypothetical protein [Methanospirillum sp.]